MGIIGNYIVEQNDENKKIKLSSIVWLRCPKLWFYHGDCYSLLHDLPVGL